MANLRENRDFKNLFASIKKRYEVGGVEDTTLEADVHTAIDNMITAIELGIGDEAFIGLFLPRFNRIFDEKLSAPAAISCIDGVVTLYINPQLLFMICEGYDDFFCVIQHEVYHLVFKHLIPSRNYPNHERANIAMDTAINQHIRLTSNLKSMLWTLEAFNNNFKCHAEAEREFEYYYDLIPNDFNDGNNQLRQMLQDLEDAKNENQKNPSKENQQKVDDLKQKISDYLKNHMVSGDVNKGAGGQPIDPTLADQLAMEGLLDQAINEAKNRGVIPGGVQNEINDLYFKAPILSWKSEFRNIIGKTPCPYKKTMRVRNRRQPNRGDLLGRVNDRRVSITIAVDTSGSVSDDELKYFFNETFNIIKDIKCEITLIQCDSKVNSIEKITKKEDVKKIKLSGRGGTCFQPVFEAIKHDIKKVDYPDVVLYFTDGYGESHIPIELKPKATLMWVLTGYDNHISVQDPAFTQRVRLLNIEGKKYL